MNWVATSRTLIEKPKDIEQIDYAGDARTLSKKAKAQLEAARKAAATLLPSIDGSVNVSLSGYAATQDDPEPDQVHVHVVEASE